MITSTSNNKVKQIDALLKNAKNRREKGLFIIEGLRMFEETPAELIAEVYFSEDYIIRYGLPEKAKNLSYEIFSNDVFRKISDTKTPQGVMAIVKQLTYDPGQMMADGKGLYMVLEDVQDPGNLGTIMRTAEGAGVKAVYMSKGTVDIYNPKVVRATMGSIFRVPFFYHEDLKEVLSMFREKGITSYAAHLKGTSYYHELDFTGGTAFLIGNEGNGLTEETAQAAEVLMKIPMQGQLESLNASVAAAILMYEAARQRV